jgi:hypothetical protein
VDQAYIKQGRLSKTGPAGPDSARIAMGLCAITKRAISAPTGAVISAIESFSFL